MFLSPIQQIAAATLAKNIADRANDTARSAREAAETLKKIEEQNKQTLKRIEAQNIEIQRSKTIEAKNIKTFSSSPKSISVMSLFEM